MSTEIYISPTDVSIITYVGPSVPDGESRKRYQITNEVTGEYVTLSGDQYADLSPRLLRNQVED